MFRKALETIVNYLETKNGKTNKLIFLAFCTNLLSHEQNCIAVTTYVGIFWKQETVSINFLLRVILIYIIY